MVSPKFVEPLENDVVIIETDELTINCCAIMFPLIVKLPVIVSLPVIDKLPLISKFPFSADSLPIPTFD